MRVYSIMSLTQEVDNDIDTAVPHVRVRAVSDSFQVGIVGVSPLVAQAQKIELTESSHDLQVVMFGRAELCWRLNRGGVRRFLLEGILSVVGGVFGKTCIITFGA